MILLCHEYDRIVSVSNSLDGSAVAIKSKQPSEALFEIAQKYPEELVIWYHVSQQGNLNFEAFDSIFHHKKIMASFHPTENYLLDAIGYVDQSPFIKLPKNVTYPTFQMSSLVGGIHASVLNCNPFKNSDVAFDYFLNSLAKQFMRVGLFCYSEPRLLLENRNTINSKSNFYDLFRFTRQHYKTRWVFLLFFNLLVYEKRLKMLPFLYSFLFKRRFQQDDVLDSVAVKSNRSSSSEQTIDVIIPTIGRKKYLYDVLKDLSAQTHLPVNVIIVEQNPLPDSSSELDYLTSEPWPFHIDHTFTHQAGACNARNIALSKVTSEWVFLNDDDNRFENNLLVDILSKISQYGIKVATTSYLQPFEEKKIKVVHQSSIFGSGNSFLNKSILEKVKFDSRFEFGYGEDNNFGLQMKIEGYDVIYFPDPSIIHLKAPNGGFRVNFYKQWDNEEIKPLPSPTIMLLKDLHYTKHQILGYKFIYFFKRWKSNFFKINPIVHFQKFNKNWKSSYYWMNVIKREV